MSMWKSLDRRPFGTPSDVIRCRPATEFLDGRFVRVDLTAAILRKGV